MIDDTTVLDKAIGILREVNIESEELAAAAL
jgi:hypothetical protein